MAERELTLRFSQVNEQKQKRNDTVKKPWSVADKCLYFKIQIIMKQLEVVHVHSTEKSCTIDTKLFHNYKENTWLIHKLFCRRIVINKSYYFF